MLVDGLTTVPGAALKNTGIENVTSLPSTDLYDGREVNLTVVDGSNKIGPYTYYSGKWNFNASGGDSVYDIGCSFDGTLTASQTLVKLNAVRAFKLPANLEGSKATCDVAATAAVALAIYKGSTQIGSINYASGSLTATFTFATAQTFAIDDVLSVKVPASVDAVISGIAFTLAGTLA